MKNYSKKNHSDNNDDNYKKKYESKKYSRYKNNSDEKNISSKNNSFVRKSPKNKFEYNNSESKDNKLKKNFYSRKNSSNKPDNKFFINDNKNIHQEYSNKKNFEDWIWGKHSVHAALTSEKPINRIWCTSEIFSSEKFYIPLKDLKTKGVLVEEVSWNRLSQLTFGATHQGIAMQLASSDYLSLNELIDLSLSKSKAPIIVALDGITDPHNLGAIIRSAEAFNCKGIVLPQRRSAGLTGTVAKVAAGALEHIPVCRVINLNRAIDEFKRQGFMTVGLSSNEKMPITSYKEKLPTVLIVGAEDKGISLLTQKKCDFLLKIPLRGKTSSLNASVAAAISLFYLTEN